jgi:hypothetical protein
MSLWAIEFFRFIKDWWFLIALVGGSFFSMYKGIQSINSNLKDIIYQLKTFSEKLMLSEKDRAEIHIELKEHDKRLDGQKEKIIEHEQQLRTLFKERG